MNLYFVKEYKQINELIFGEKINEFRESKRGILDIDGVIVIKNGRLIG